MEIKKEETKEKVVHRQRDRTISKKGDSNIKKCGRRTKSCLLYTSRELYKDYKIKTVKAKRSINSVGNKRGEINEVLIYNE